MCQGQDTSRDTGTLLSLLWEFRPGTPTTVSPPPFAPSPHPQQPCQVAVETAPAQGWAAPCLSLPAGPRGWPPVRKPHRAWGCALAPGQGSGLCFLLLAFSLVPACPGGRESRG